MPRSLLPLLYAGAMLLLLGAAPTWAVEAAPARTRVTLVGEDFYLNGTVTYPGRVWQGHRIEGLLLNSRMVQGIFDDLNPDTVSRWAYPDTGRWDPDRNTWEFLCAMESWRRAGMLAFTLNLQGGSPTGYSGGQPWINSAFAPDGSLRPAFFERLTRVLNEADRLGMVVILGYFYFGQDGKMDGEPAIIRATDAATAWVLEKGYRNVVIEVANETNPGYTNPILRPDRIAQLITRVKARSLNGFSLLAGTSCGGGALPTETVAAASDFILLHGNSVGQPQGIIDLVNWTRNIAGARGKPIIFNEDDHFDFQAPTNNFIAAVSKHASWGYFDYRLTGDAFEEGFQSMPVEWRILGSRKVGFFNLLADMTGSPRPQVPVKAGDADRNGVVDAGDLAIVKAQLGRRDDEIVDYRADLDRNRHVDAEDLGIVTRNQGR